MSPSSWSRARAVLAARDPVIARLIAALPGRRLQPRSDPFTALARAIVGQQISVKAAATVWGRLQAGVPDLCPATVVCVEGEALRGMGLSRQKAAYLQDLAQHFHDGRLQPALWAQLEDEAVIARLTEVKGIGRWTAEMFLIFHLQRPDVLPVDDVGLQRAVSLHYNRGRPVSQARLRKIAQPWTPWRSIATWYLWRSLEAKN